MDENTERILNAEWLILDVEYIQDHKHRCIRKLAYITKHGVTGTAEFFPCRELEDLSFKDRRSFWFCYYNIHGLSFKPTTGGGKMCCDAIAEIGKILATNNCDVILYKGGDIEKKLGEEIGVETFDIEKIGVGKANNHDPLQEVIFYRNQLNMHVL